MLFFIFLTIVRYPTLVTNRLKRHIDGFLLRECDYRKRPYVIFILCSNVVGIITYLLKYLKRWIQKGGSCTKRIDNV